MTQLWTLAYEDGTAMVHVLAHDGVDIEAELAKIEANISAEIDRDEVVIETGLTLTDDIEPGDELVFTFEKRDPATVAHYAVRRA